MLLLNIKKIETAHNSRVGDKQVVKKDETPHTVNIMYRNRGG